MAAVPPVSPGPRRRWSFYRTELGADPVRAYLSHLPAGDRAVVGARMRAALNNPKTARPVGGDVFEVQASRNGQAHRVLFIREGPTKGDFVALDAFAKASARVPRERLRVAQDRARDWRSRRGRTMTGPEMSGPTMARGASR